MKTIPTKTIITAFLLLTLLSFNGFGQLSINAGAIDLNTPQLEAGEGITESPLQMNTHAGIPARTSITKAKKAKNSSALNWDNSFIGIGLGVRRFNNVPTDIYLKNDDGEDVPLELGQGKPFQAMLHVLLQPAEMGPAFTMQVEGYLGASSSFGFHMGGGYKIGNHVISVTPLATIGVNRLMTHIESVGVGDEIVVDLFDPNAPVYVGPSANNIAPGRYLEYGDSTNRGGGGNLNYRMNSSYFTLKPELNVSLKASDKITIFGSIAYNVVFAKTKNEATLTARGYDNFDQYWNSDKPAHLLELDAPNNQVVDINDNVYEKSPIGLSGMSMNFGVGFNLE
jgi:hypothetical protein